MILMKGKAVEGIPKLFIFLSLILSLRIYLEIFTDLDSLHIKFIRALPQRLPYKSTLNRALEPNDTLVLRALEGTARSKHHLHLVKLINDTDFNLWVFTPTSTAKNALPGRENYDDTGAEFVAPHSAANAVFPYKSIDTEYTLYWKLDNLSSSTGFFKYVALVCKAIVERMEATINISGEPENCDSLLRYSANITVEYRIPGIALVESGQNEVNLGIFVLHEYMNNGMRICLSSSIAPEKWNLDKIVVDGAITRFVHLQSIETTWSLRVNVSFCERGRYFIGSLCRVPPDEWTICGEINILTVD